MAKKLKKPKKSVSEPEPPMQSATSSHNLGQRPKSSPYTSSLIPLRIGREQKEYYIPRVFLQNIESIESSYSWGFNIDLPDVDDSIGHTLIHYLYTGTYQTLDDVEASPEQKIYLEFRRAVLVRFTAQKYRLPVLGELAEQKIEQFNAVMSIFDIIEAFKHHFSTLPTPDVWFHDYIFEKVKVAFENDHTVFKQKDLFSSINDIAFTRLLANCIMELYENKVSSMLTRELPPEPGTSDGIISKPDDVPVEALPVEEPLAAQKMPDEIRPIVKESVLDEPAPAPEPEKQNDSDESWTPKKSMKKKKKSLFQEVPPPPPDEPDPEPKPAKNYGPWAAWSSSYAKEKGEKAIEPVVEECPPPPEPAPEPEPVENDDWGFSGTKKTKKNGKKTFVEEKPRTPELLPEPEPEPAPAVTEPVTDDPWGFGTTKKKAKKKTSVIIRDVPVPPEPEPESVPVAVDQGPWIKSHGPGTWGSTSLKKKKKKGASPVIEEQSASPPEVEPEPAPEPATEEDPWAFSFAAQSSSIQKKKKKGSAVIEEHHPPPPADPKTELDAIESAPDPEACPVQPEPGKEVDPWASWGSTATRTKKKTEKQKKAAASKQWDEAIAEEKAREEAEEAARLTEKENTRQSLETGPQTCPLRAQHVLEGEQWKTCNSCRAFLQQIVTELGPAGSPVEGSFEMVDRVVSN